MSFRKIVFWLHLFAGLVAGLVIALMSATGVVLAYEQEIVAWAERDVRRVEAPAGAPALPLDRLLADFRKANPDVRPAGVTVSADPRNAVAIAGHDTTYYLNPYTGEVRRPAASRTRDFMRTVVELHRYLGQTDDQRALGKAVTGACNLAFLFLAVSGLWLWWPRAWSLRALRPSLWFLRNAPGRARDWNWHNVIGFWSLPVLVVLTVSGGVIGYKWMSDLVYRVAGEQPPPPGAVQLPASLAFDAPAAGAPRLSHGAILARIQRDNPDWKTITVREGLPRRRGATPAVTPAPTGPQPYSATVVSNDLSYVTASSQLALNPFTGESLTRLGYEDYTAGRKIRTWLRYLHTGQALGWPGQLVAGIASLGGVFLVYTGFALSWRRFFGRKKSAAKT